MSEEHTRGEEMRAISLPRPPVWAIALAAGLVALAVGCYQLSLPHVLAGTLGYNEGYDDGVYVGEAIRFVHGALLYRDFTVVEPPGIAYILAPVALIGSAMTAHTALILGHILTVLVTAANPVLAGLLVRRGGRLAVGVAAFSLALWPMTVALDRAVELEPYLVFFSLLGAVVLFGRDDDPSKRRLLAAGVLFGFACLTKAWGVLPTAGALIVCLPRWRRGYQWLVGGVALGIVVPSLPFLIGAPGRFWHDVVADQLGRNYLGASTSLIERLFLISGIPGLPATNTAPTVALGISAPTGTPAAAILATVGFIVIALVTIAVFGLGWRRRRPFEWLALAMFGISFVGMFYSALMFDHYAYFPAAMLAPLLGVLAVGVKEALAPRLNRARVRTFTVRRAEAGLVTAVAIGAAVFLVGQNTSYAAYYLSEASDPSALAAYIPPGACVISDFPSDLIVTNRYTSSTKGCPSVVDPLGMYIADDDGLSPHPSPPYPFAFSEQWFADLQEAQYVELRTPYSDLIPWQQYMITWFGQNYTLIVHLHYSYPRTFIDSNRDIYLYKRTS